MADKVRDYYKSLARNNSINGFYDTVSRRDKIQSFYTRQGRDYYGSAMDDSQDPQSDVMWSNGKTLYPRSKPSIIKAGLITGAVLAAGKLPLPGGGRVWDKYVSGLRHFEEYFFMRIPRTLQLSNIFSQFETKAKQTRILTPAQLMKLEPGQIDYIERLTGVDSYGLLKGGLRFENNQLFLHQGDNAGVRLLSHASVIRNVNKSAHFSTAIARSLGTAVNDKVFTKPIEFTLGDGKTIANEVFQFTGGHDRLQHWQRQVYGYGTELIERANRLARAPIDFPVVGPVIEKIFGRRYLGVKSGAGLETLARLTGKLGLLGGASYLGFKTLDWATHHSITRGAATAWAKFNLGYAKIGDITGWHQSREEQERYAPGSTSLTKLAAFPIMGAVGAGILHYIKRGAIIAQAERRGATVEFASRAAEKLLRGFKGEGLISKLGRRLLNSRYSVVRSVAKSPLTVMAAVGAVIGTIPVLPFIFNALAPEHSEADLRDIYAGKKEVAIKRNRWWELGRSPYEGTNTAYYRPNWYARMMQDGKEKTIWGPLEQDGELSPLTKSYRKNFTYDLEATHYHDMPYPVTGRGMYDTPIIGPLLSATIGRIFKPPVMMHQEDFYNSGTGQYVNLSPGFGADRNTAMGELGPGTPISPHGLKGTIGEQFYRMTELTGLPGFLFNTIKQGLTGTQDLFDKEKYLASADEIDSMSRDYTDQNLGGMVFSNELLRRMIPHKRNQIETYNPIRNTMPDWMPTSGDRGIDFQHGNPYALVPEGEIRLPGAGYAERFPELRGVDPADYPLIHQYKILADIAPFSNKFQAVEQKLAIADRKGNLSDADEAIYRETKEQLKEKRNKRTFDEYKYKKENLDPVQKALADWNEKQKKPEDKIPWYERVLGSYWQTLSHSIETPLEYITPLAPAAKLVHMRTAVEDYAKNQVYGTENAFWDRPWSNFIRPFVTSTAHLLGSEEVPEAVKDKRKLEEYFDMLKYLKFTRLKNIAEGQGDQEATKEFETRRRETLFGVNPYTFNYTDIFRALPRRDRDYFNSFVDTKDMDKRAEILKMIPDNEKGLFIAKWRQTDATDFAKAVKLGLLKQDEVDKGDAQVEKMYDDMSSEGLDKSKELWQEYIKTRQKGESYADWYRRAKLLPKKAEELGVNIPGPDWVGFNPAVDLDDIKLKVVQNLGESIQDYDLWPSREKQMLYRQSYINDDAVSPIEANHQDPSTIRSNIQKILSDFNIHDVQIDVSMVSGNNNHVNMDIQEDRSKELKDKLRAN